MWAPDLFDGRRYAVLGLGRNGLPAAAALAAMGADVSAWDDDPANRAHLPDGVAAREPTEMVGLDALVISPGIPDSHPAARRAAAAAVPVLSDAELLYQAVRLSGSRARFAGITGTNGKSTTTALLAHILAASGIPAAAGGNLGPAALALPLLPDPGVYVLEMSSYMLERLATIRFDAAVLLNLTPDHLDRHGDMAGYERAKRHIFDRQEAGDLALHGETDPEPVPGCPGLPGAHNAQNARAAIAMARHLGADDAAIESGLRSFPGLPHRQRTVARAGGIAFVDDSKGTNADAAARALGCYDRVVWIAGGTAKAGGIDSLAPFFPRVAHAVLIGRDAPVLAATLAAAGVPHETAVTLDRAVPIAHDAARRLGADTVILSPACASFDQFPNYEARGRRFAELARAIGETVR